MIQMGRYTAALLLIATGVALVVDQTSDTHYLRMFLDWWPLVFIALGIEVILLSLIYRQSDKRLRFSFGSMFGALAIAFVALLLTGYGEGKVNVENWRFWESGFRQYERPAERYAIPDNTRKIRITNANGDVILRPGDTDELVIESVVRYFNFFGEEQTGEPESSVSITQGETMEIEVSGQRYRQWLWRISAQVDVTVTIPRDRSFDYEVDLSNGDVIVRDLEVSRKLKVELSNGDITVHHAGGELDLVTRNGAVDVIGARSALRIKTNNGHVSARSPVVGGDWSVETDNGDITLEVPEQGDYSIRGERDTGHFSTSISWLKISRDRIEGRIGEGTYSISADTDNGDINISYYRE